MALECPRSSRGGQQARKEVPRYVAIVKSFPSPNVRCKIQRRQETNAVVVGGGLSSAQIVDMAVRQGVTKVWFVMRSDMKGGLIPRVTY